MNWIQDMNKLTGPDAPLRLPAAVEVRGMLANGVQIPLTVRGVYELRDGKTGVYVTMPDADVARHAICEAEAAQLRAEIKRLRATIEFAAHKLEGGRIWGGMAWHMNPLHPALYQPALERLRAALAPNVAMDSPPW